VDAGSLLECDDMASSEVASLRLQTFLVVRLGRKLATTGVLFLPLNKYAFVGFLWIISSCSGQILGTVPLRVPSRTTEITELDGGTKAVGFISR
jgi:hypothetical protein